MDGVVGLVTICSCDIIEGLWSKKATWIQTHFQTQKAEGQSHHTELHISILLKFKLSLWKHSLRHCHSVNNDKNFWDLIKWCVHATDASTRHSLSDLLFSSKFIFFRNRTSTVFTLTLYVLLCVCREWTESVPLRGIWKNNPGKLHVITKGIVF